MMRLGLEIPKFEGTDRWTWRLSDGDGRFLADHQVALDSSSPEYAGFHDLEDFLHLNTVLQGAPEAEWDLLWKLARWSRDHVWGAVGEAILEAAEAGPVVVHVFVPAGAEMLLFKPLELAFVLADAPAGRDVSLVFDVAAGEDPPPKEPATAPLRMLALFSMPTDQSALNVRHERRELRQLAQRVTHEAGRAIELRVLQYGVTRKLLEEVLDDGGGWDIIHFSGHGLPAGLILEKEDGSADVIASGEFIHLLRPARAKIKLVALSSCDSGATTATATMKMLGVAGAEKVGELPSGSEAAPARLPSVAQNLAAELGCAVLAMRFPVADDFAIRLTSDVYEGLFTYDLPLPRSLQRSLRKARSDEMQTQAVSMATPALFGTAALDLRVAPPLGSPSKFETSQPRLAYFDPEPEHFVGRVGPLAAASAALAPKSSYRGILFHGMAGAGKTACALELAYRHQEARFEAMAWFRAPSEGDSIRTSLADFAVALETQIDGFEMAHVVNEVERLKRFLPRLKALLAERSILIAVDNIESLLHPDGEWRDERWQMLVRALLDHDGLSRLVLTSRIPPADLPMDSEVLTEPINTLSASESALLARQLPNLSRLMSEKSPVGQPAGLELARRTLEIVQGNPKLIELADRQASDVKALESRIEEADKLWMEGVNLMAFFTTGTPDKQIGAADFLRILQRWTDGIARMLPHEQRLAFQVISCLEPMDRSDNVFELAWKKLWGKLDLEGDAPDPRATLDGLSYQGLIGIEQRRGYRFISVHPAVEEASRHSVSDELRAAIDAELATLWITFYQEGFRSNQTHAQAVAGFSAAPYLLRNDRAQLAAQLLENAIINDPSAKTLATALPQLERAAEMASGTEDEIIVRRALLRARASQRSPELAAEIEEILDIARKNGDYRATTILLNDLYNELFRKGRLKEAKETAEEKTKFTRLSNLGPWSQMSDEGQRLQAMLAMGENEQVLAEAKRLLERIDATPVTSDADEVATPWNVKEGVLSIATRAAGYLREHEVALEMNRKSLKSKERRNASPLELALTQFNDTGSLIDLGRLSEAEKILRSILATIDKFGDPRVRGQVLMTWADLESHRDRIAEAIKFQRRGLRVTYLVEEPEWINIGHHNLANFLSDTEESDRELILAHRIVVPLISFQTESGDFKGDVEALAGAIAWSDGNAIPPDSFEAMCNLLEKKEDVPVRTFFSRLPSRLGSPEDAFQAVRKAALSLLSTSSPQKPEESSP